MFPLTGLYPDLHAGDGDVVRRVHSDQQAEVRHCGHQEIHRAHQGGAEGLQDSLGGKISAVILFKKLMLVFVIVWEHETSEMRCVTIQC